MKKLIIATGKGANMRTTKNFALAVMLGFSAVASLPLPALAHERWDDRGSQYEDDNEDSRDQREYRREGYRERPDDERRSRYRCQTSGTTGLIVGGALGALVGRGIDRHGDRATGTVLGAGGGALVGREIDRNHRC